MRKLLWLVTIMVVALAFAACGGDDKEKPASSNTTGGTSAPKLNLKTDGQLTRAC